MAECRAESFDSKDLVSIKLHEKDILGAFFNGRDPNSLKVPELKCWLICRGASTRGNKPDLSS
uniref:SAP domain-containing protein n=1 Tax=Amphimedon queenslandica TaxID=400682 RepID=A0A1X7TGB7_AMPQE